MRTPSTSMRSISTSALSPSVATRPLTVTRPASISSSQVRRLPSPTPARIFCRRSPSLGGIERVGKQPLFERFHHLRTGDELPEAREVVERREPEPLEELLRRAVQHGQSG